MAGPGHPVEGAAKSPEALVRKFRRDVEYNTHRQRKWARGIAKQRKG